MITVDEYLWKLKRAQRSPVTINGYRKVLTKYAKFCGVPLDDLHNNLSVDTLTLYATTGIEKGRAPSGVGTDLRIVHKFFSMNGIVINGLDLDIIKNPGIQDDNDETEIIGAKPLTIELLQRMIDQADSHSKAIITTLISTGMRSGECSKLLLTDVGRLENNQFTPDVNGNIIKIRSKIAKGRVTAGKKTGGGYVFLNAEARQYLSDWLHDRDAFISAADKRAGTDKQWRFKRLPNDHRLFASSYHSMRGIWDRLYNRIDGERGTYQKRCTLHSTRAYFRTQLSRTVRVDIVERIMRHRGYLPGYVRYSPTELEREYRAGEHALYITHPLHREQMKEISELRKKVESFERVLTSVNKDSSIFEVIRKEGL